MRRRVSDAELARLERGVGLYGLPVDVLRARSAVKLKMMNANLTTPLTLTGEADADGATPGRVDRGDVA